MSRRYQEVYEELQKHDFEGLMKTTANPREKLRFLAFVHLKNSKTVPDVAAIVRTSRKTVYCWLRAFEKEGIKGLKERGGRGRKPLLRNETLDKFKEAIREMQEREPGKKTTLRDIQGLMKREFNIQCALKTAYNHMKKIKDLKVSEPTIAEDKQKV